MLAGADASFDALAHVITLATIGYSTKTSSIVIDSIIELIIIAGMIVGSLPFVHYLALTRGGWKGLWNDPQVKCGSDGRRYCPHHN